MKRKERVCLFRRKEIQAATAWRFIRVAGKIRQVFRMTGGTVGFTAYSNLDLLSGVRNVVNRQSTLPYIQKGLLFDDGGDGGYNTSVEFGHMTMNALGALYDPSDPESVRAAAEIVPRFNNIGLEKYKFIVPVMAGASLHNMQGPMLSDYHLWQRKIKRFLTPMAYLIHLIILAPKICINVEIKRSIILKYLKTTGAYNSHIL